jgi:transcriptional regulator with XRE-family HTH domain
MDGLLKQARSCSKWRERMGFTKSEACRQLGLSRPAWDAYENGERSMPLYVALACEALERRAIAKR